MSLLGLEGLVLKLTLTQYYKQNLFKQNLLIDYKNTSLSQSSSVTFFIILLPVTPKMVYNHVSIASIAESSTVEHRNTVAKFHTINIMGSGARLIK